MSSVSLVLGLVPTMLFINEPFDLRWIVAGFFVGANDGMSQTVGMKLASILAKNP